MSETIGELAIGFVFEYPLVAFVITIVMILIFFGSWIEYWIIKFCYERQSHIQALKQVKLK